jgi:rhamnose transport system ATP-binding protein
VLVVCEGRITAELSRDEATPEAVMHAATAHTVHAAEAADAGPREPGDPGRPGGPATDDNHHQEVTA